MVSRLASLVYENSINFKQNIKLLKHSCIWDVVVKAKDEFEYGDDDDDDAGLWYYKYEHNIT